MEPSKKLIPIITVASLVVVLLLGGLYAVLSRAANKRTGPQPIAVSPTMEPVLSITPIADPKTVKEVPTFAPDLGRGINISSAPVRASQAEIEKFTALLPYTNTLSFPNGDQVEVVIPQADYQDNSWTLLVNVNGLDFQVPEGTNEYTVNKYRFKQIANSVYTWIQNRGADPSKIIIIWGDREFIQNRAEEWLQD